MQVTLNFFKNNSERNVLNKDLINGVVLTATLKADTPIEQPTFLLSKAFDYEYNYLYCEELDKYYFVDAPTITQGAMKNIQCTEDALCSLASKVLNLECTVSRNERYKNGYLIDNGYATANYEQVVTKAFPNAVDQDSVILMTMG